MKYKLIRFLDVTGLGVLDPVLRLAYGDEPRLQLRKIGLYIVMPVVVFLLFLAIWDFLGPRHKTKSGEVPTPAVVLSAFGGIVEFHDREYRKLEDYALEGEAREAALAEVEAGLERNHVASAEATRRFEELQSRYAGELASRIEPCERVVAAREAEYREEAAAARIRLLAWADTIAAADSGSKARFLEAVELFMGEQKRHRDHIKDLRAEIDARRQVAFPDLDASRKRKNALDQEAQFLQKRLVHLTDANRSIKVDLASTLLREQAHQFRSAAGGAALLALATGMVNQEARIDSIRRSEYAKPPTFFDQIVTSLKCVFLGFLLATVIAIPLGVLCGLSPVFMASITPLISLFKPVSPIVWLPIVFIVVGGFIAVPEEAWLPPAFLSTAITVALCSLWPTLINTALGVASIEQDHLNVARMLRLGFWSRLVKIVIPASLPLIFAGLRISLGVGWMVLIAGELLSSSPGLGKFVWDMFNNGSSETFAQMFVVVFFVGGIGFLLDRLMVVFQRLVSFDEAPTAI